jgi:hypothetical protein
MAEPTYTGGKNWKTGQDLTQANLKEQQQQGHVYGLDFDLEVLPCIYVKNNALVTYAGTMGTPIDVTSMASSTIDVYINDSNAIVANASGLPSAFFVYLAQVVIGANGITAINNIQRRNLPLDNGNIPQQRDFYVETNNADTSQASLVLTGLDGDGVVHVSDGADRIAITLSSDLTVDTDTTGAGGLDTGSLSDDSDWYLYLITKDAGADPVLILSEDADPSFLTFPTDYTHWSKALAHFYVETASAKLPKIVAYELGRKQRYREPVQLVDATGSTSGVAIDFSKLVPASVKSIELEIKADNDTATDTTCQILVDTEVNAQLGPLSTVKGYKQQMIIDLPISSDIALATDITYKFTANETDNIQVYLRGWEAA